MSAFTGKAIRMNRLIQAETNACIICAIDHGISIGRNIFQHRRPELIVGAISRVFRDGWSHTQALEELDDALASTQEA